MKLGGTYISKNSPVLAAQVSVSMVMASMYRGLLQIFPGFLDFTSHKSSQSPVPPLSSLLNHSVQQAAGSNNSQMERWLQDTSWNLEEVIRGWPFSGGAVGGVAAEANTVIATLSFCLVIVLADEADAHVVSETWREAFEPAALSNLSCISDHQHGVTRLAESPELIACVRRGSAYKGHPGRSSLQGWKKKKKKSTVSPVQPLMVLFLLAQSIMCSWEMISVYGKAAPVTSLICTQGENQARRRNSQLLPFGFTIPWSGSSSCAGKRKERDYQRLIKSFSIGDANLPETKPARRMRLSGRRKRKQWPESRERERNATVDIPAGSWWQRRRNSHTCGDNG